MEGHDVDEQRLSWQEKATMLANVAAHLIVLIHLGFILFAALGGLLVLKWRRVAFLHLPCVAWGVWIEFSGRVCPLTPLENRFRILAGEQGYSGGFIEHYIWPVMYPEALSRDLQLLLGLALLVLNVLIYIHVYRRRVQSSG